MKKNRYIIFALLMFPIVLFAQNRYWVSGGVGNWSGDNWASSSTGVPDGGGAPTLTETAYFTGNGLGNCNLDVAVNINNIRIENGYTGTIDLLGFSCSFTGSLSNYFRDGIINDTPGTSAVNFGTTSSVTFEGTTFNAKVTGSSSNIRFNGGIFNATVELEANSSSSGNGQGGCTFNDVVKITNSGTGYFLMGQANPDIFNGDLELINTSSSRIRIAYSSAGNEINGNLTLSNTGGGIWFGENGGAIELASSKSISIGVLGFDKNELIFRNFTQLGSTAQNLSLSGTATLRLKTGTVFNGDVNFDAPRIRLDGATFNGTSDFEKTGASSDGGVGGNVFVGNSIIRNSGSGYFMLGNGNSDAFTNDLLLQNVGSSVIYLAYNSLGNTIGGNLSIVQNSTGNANVSISTRVSSVNVAGDLSVLNNGNGNTQNIDLGDGGNLTIGGNLDIQNGMTGTGNSFTTTVADDNASNVSVGGTTTVSNGGSANISRVYLGDDGDVVFNGDLTINNSATASGSEIYCNHRPNSNNSYNENIILTSPGVGSDGIFFGYSGGSSVLAANKTVTIGGTGFIGRYLYFRNFVQTGNTPQSLSLDVAGTSIFYNYDSDWGGNVNFSAPRIYTRGTTYRGLSELSKTGAGSEYSEGGNVFMNNFILNNSGSGALVLGSNTPDDYQVNVTINNTGTSNVHLGYSSLGNTIAGDLTLVNSTSGGSTESVICNRINSSITIGGNVSILNNGTASSIRTYLGASGKIISVGGNITAVNNSSGNSSSIYITGSDTLNLLGDLTLNNIGTSTNQTIYLSNYSSAHSTIGGNTIVTNSGVNNTSRVYLSNSGSSVFNGTIAIQNSSSASNSQVYLGYGVSCSNVYNENITVASTDANCDGVVFGGSGGAGVLAATKTVSLGAGGFVAGQLYFRNFTQIGNTAHTISLDPLGTATFYNYDSDWGGDVNFSGPRMYTRGTTYRRTCQLTKVGAGSDYSNGGNVFMDDLILNNSGSSYLLMGGTNSDDFQGNVTMNNTSTNNMYLAYTSLGNSIAGNLTINNATTGASSAGVTVCSGAVSSISIAGDVSILNTSSANNGSVYLGNSGKISLVGGNLDVINNGTGNQGNVYLVSRDTLTLVGNLTISNIGTATNQYVYVANSTNSYATVGGTSNIVNSGTGNVSRVYLGSQGSVVFNGELNLSNNSPSNNSQIYLNRSSNSSNIYNENIVVESYAANCDGIMFGDAGGTGVLAANKTVTIGANGYSDGYLSFRNFTQTGNTPQTLNLNPAGVGYFYNYDSDWGGNINFSGPRMVTRGTTYRGLVYLEKTLASNDASQGGNTFMQNTELKNTGTGYFLMGSGSPDVFQGDLVMNNLSQSSMYLGYNSAGNLVAGNLTLNQNTTGNSTAFYVSERAISTVQVNGNTNVNITSSSNTSRLYLGGQGDLDLLGALTIVNNGTSSNYCDVMVANSSSSTVNVTGNTVISNIGSAPYNRVYIYNNGNGVFNGTVDVTNGGTGNRTYTVFGSGSSSFGTFNDVVTLSNSGANNIKNIYVGNSGDLTFNANLSLTNTATASSSTCYFNNGANSANNYNGNIILEAYGANCDGISFGSSGGVGVLANSKTISLGANGFTDGRLYFRNFTQLGGTAQAIITTNNSRMENYNSTWNGNSNFISPRQHIRSSTFNGVTFIEKTGSGSDASYGDNTYNLDVTFKNSGTGYFMPTNNHASDHNGNVSYIKTGTGRIYPTASASSTYAGDINFDFNSSETFCYSTGRVIMDGTSAQSINDLGASPIVKFRRLRINNPSNEVTLNTPIEVSTEIDLIAGNIISDATNFITMLDNSNVITVSNNSFVDGPIQKRGNDLFKFPVGKNGVYRPIEISNPASSSAMFKAEFFDTDPHLSGYNHGAKDVTLNHISNCEYWILDRTNMTNNVNVKLYYDSYGSSSCSGVDNQSELAVARWDGTKWKDHGNGGVGGTTANGWVTTSSAVTSFSPFTLASTTVNNPLPIELVSFDANRNESVVNINWETASEINNDYFTIERSKDGVTFEALQEIEGAGTSNQYITYKSIDENPLRGTSYYRLKQTDFNGDFTYSDVKVVTFNKNEKLAVYPNPVKDILNISGITNTDEVIIYSIDGKKVYEGNSTKINVSSFSFGVYQLIVKHKEGKVEVLKFVK